MAQFHMHMQIIGGGRSAVAASAYRSGEKLQDKETGKIQDYTHKQGVAYTRVLLPENAPREFEDRETLWNSVQEAEKGNPKAQYARELEASFPKELTLDQCKEIAETYCKENLVSKGMCVDYAIEMKEGNPHIHIMATLRELDKEGKWANKSKEVFANDRDENGKAIYNPEKPIYDPKNRAETEQYRIPKLDKDGNQKTRYRAGKGEEKLWEKVKIEPNDWNSRENARLWRENWAKECNKYLSKENQIDPRSYKERGIEKAATIHEGYAAREMEKRGKVSDRCEINRTIKALNKELDKVRAEMKALEKGRTMSEGAKSRLADIVGKDSAITAGFTNSGGHDSKGGERWDLMTEQRKDEIRWKNAIKDDYGDEEKSLMSDWKPKMMNDAPDNILADLFKDNFKNKEEERSNGRGTDPDRGRVRGRTHRANDKVRASLERAVSIDFTANRRSTPVRDQSQGRDDLKSFLAGINAKVRSAEAGRQDRDAEQRRLAEERERATKEREQKAKRSHREREYEYSRSR